MNCCVLLVHSNLEKRYFSARGCEAWLRSNPQAATSLGGPVPIYMCAFPFWIAHRYTAFLRRLRTEKLLSNFHSPKFSVYRSQTEKLFDKIYGLRNFIYICTPFRSSATGEKYQAQVAELVDALVSGASFREEVQVRFLSWAPLRKDRMWLSITYGLSLWFL